MMSCVVYYLTIYHFSLQGNGSGSKCRLRSTTRNYNQVVEIGNWHSAVVLSRSNIDTAMFDEMGTRVLDPLFRQHGRKCRA